MIAQYPAIYEDAHGAEQATIENDGKLLRMVIRGVEFQSTEFDDFEPTLERTDPRLAWFAFDHGYLCSYRLECTMSLPVVVGHEIIGARLLAQLELGEPRPGGNRGLAREGLRLCLTIGDTSFWSSGTSRGYFDNELDDIQRALPDNVYLKACINCAFSDYSPFGNGMFGCMACFRDNKAAYRQVTDQRGLFAIWDTRTDFVQETYLCPEFERRQPRTGYRG